MKFSFSLLFLASIILFIPPITNAETDDDAENPYLDSIGEASKATSFDEMFDIVSDDSTVRLIVSLKIPEDELDSIAITTSTSIDERKKIVKQIQNNFLSQLDLPSGEDSPVLHTFDYSPFILLELDSNTLESFANSELVDRVMQDVPEPLLLARSNPVIGSPVVWSNGFTGEGQTIAILDTGVDSTHDMLNGKIVSEACFSTNNPASFSSSACPNGLSQEIGSGAAVPCDVPRCSHGTHVAGIAAGNTVTSGPSTYAGVAKGADVIAIQVFSEVSSHPKCVGPCPLSYPSDQIKGLERVLDLRNDFNIASVNLSLGAGSFATHCDSSDLRGQVINDLNNAGIAVIAASGNSGYVNGISTPACIQNAISVGSTDTQDMISSFSNSAQILDLLAPGDDIRSSVPGNVLSYKGGTSMAAPHVAGAWAVLQEGYPNASNAEIFSALKDTGVLVTDSRNGVITPRIQVNDAICDLPNPVGHCKTLVSGISSDATVQVDVYVDVPETNGMADLNVQIMDASSNQMKNNANYNIKASHNGQEILSELNMHSETGSKHHTTINLVGDVDDSHPILIEIELLGFGLVNDETNWTDPKGEILMYTVVPEFGAIVLMILGVSLLTTILFAKKSTVFLKI